MPDTLTLRGPGGLPAAMLVRRCDPAEVPFDSTAEVEASPAVFGQERALGAIRFATGVEHADCNVFVMGPPGIGKRSLVKAVLAERAAAGTRPNDWVYVNNFQDPRAPIAIELPPGLGAALRRDVESLLAELRSGIPAIFESEDYSHRVEKIDAEFNERRESAVAEIAAQAERQGITLLRTPAGFAFVPVKDGEALPPEAFEKLPDEERARIAVAVSELQDRLEKVVHEALRSRKDRNARVRDLNREMVMLVVGQLVEDLLERYAPHAKVVEYLHALQQDVLENAESFQRASEPEGLAAMGGIASDGAMRRYGVNILVDRGESGGAEVVFCEHPTFANLVGRIEHVQHLGTLVTDFTLLKAGDLHRANGGFLVIEALKLLTQPFAWEAFKRALRSAEIRIESPAESWGLSSTVSLAPKPIPLEVRVVLMGDRRLYYLLEAFDPDFHRLFKVVADFDEVLERDSGSCAAYARTVAGLAREDALLPFDRGSVARLIEEAARRASDSRKLSADRARLRALLRESDFIARGAGATMVAAAHVDRALEAQRARCDRLRLRLREAIERGTILIDTTGRTVGQVNALAMIDVGEFPFAEPARITATTRVGEGQLVDIQREARLGGAIHSKGVLILSQFLAARFSGREPLSLAASLAFEQTYGLVEGDSASLAELCALLSSLANVAVRQSLAVTGSVNQRGDVQAVGGVNEKIEGFHDLCARRGLTGEQGVVIPAANVEHLMLRDAVVESVAAGRFHVYPVATVDEALEILTGMPAGLPEAAGGAPPDTVNGRVVRRLREFAQRRVSISRRKVSFTRSKRVCASASS